MVGAIPHLVEQTEPNDAAVLEQPLHLDGQGIEHYGPHHDKGTSATLAFAPSQSAPGVHLHTPFGTALLKVIARYRVPNLG
ncbi:MAG: hypothetical protein ACYDH5_15315 [Acidimicrobiales bacterium]